MQRQCGIQGLQSGLLRILLPLSGPAQIAIYILILSACILIFLLKISPSRWGVHWFCSGKTLSSYFSSSIEIDLKMSARCLSQAEILRMCLVLSDSQNRVLSRDFDMPSDSILSRFCTLDKKTTLLNWIFNAHACLFWFALDRSYSLNASQQNLPLKLLNILLLTWTSLMTENACLTC